MTTPPSRRAFLAVAGAGTLVALGVAGAGSAAATPGASSASTLVAGRKPSPGKGGKPGSKPPKRSSTARAYDFLDTATNAYPAVNTGPRLAQSYADQLGLFSTAFVYDNALAICAYLAGGRAHLRAARALGDGLVFALENDPEHDDGRLRQAYNVGPYVFYDGTPQDHGLVLPDGTANIGWQFGFLGTAVGDMAWPGIALLHLYAATGERRYLRGALAIARWITTNTWSRTGLGGFSFGVDGSNVPIPNVSTEHNIDCVAFFRQLAALTRERSWVRAQQHAHDFVLRTWEPRGQFFYTGSNDGVELNRDPLPLDPQTWGWLALRDRKRAGTLDWAASALATRDKAGRGNSQLPPGVHVEGVTFSSGSLTSDAEYNDLPVHQQGVWLEGTAQLATAFVDRDAKATKDRKKGRVPSDRARADALLREVRVAQDEVGAGQTMGEVPLPERSGIVAASSLLDSGFGFGYFQVQHVGATAWYLMAAERSNPLQVRGL